MSCAVHAWNIADTAQNTKQYYELYAVALYCLQTLSAWIGLEVGRKV